MIIIHFGVVMHATLIGRMVANRTQSLIVTIVVVGVAIGMMIFWTFDGACVEISIVLLMLAYTNLIKFPI